LAHQRLREELVCSCAEKWRESLNALDAFGVTRRACARLAMKDGARGHGLPLRDAFAGDPLKNSSRVAIVEQIACRKLEISHDRDWRARRALGRRSAEREVQFGACESSGRKAGE
jgi:hypothetical protein